MPSLSPRQMQLVPFAIVGILAILSLIRLLEAGDIPWVAIAALGVVTAVLTGPVLWLARDRLSEQRRERLGLVAFGIGMLLVPIGLGLALAFRVPLLPSFDALIVGVFVGSTFVLIAERTVVPERLRETV